MTDAAAPTLLLYHRRSTLETVELDAEREIGAGGEAVVYHVPGDVGLVAKVYHDPALERARKLALMLANPPAMPAGTSIAWPLDVLLNGRGFAGFVMPFAEGPRVFEFYNPVTRRTHAPGFHFGLLHRAGRNLAAAFDALHAAGYVVGDVNESNLLVAPHDARVTIVDADSLQVRDPGGGVFRSRVGKAEFTPPELQGVSFETVDRAPEHDRFGLAVLLFLLLMEGTHPFAVRLDGGADAEPVEDRIRRGLFPHASPDDDCHPPRLSPPFEALDAGVREMFIRAFVAGHADPAARPTAAEWRGALETAEARLIQCGANPLHRFAMYLDACPWCERAWLLGGRDPFPVGAPVAVAPVPRPRVRHPQPAAPSSAPPPPPPLVSPHATRGALMQGLNVPAPPGADVNAVVNAFFLIPCSLALVVLGGFTTVIGLILLAGSLGALSIPEFRKPTWARGVLGMLAAFIVLVAGAFLQGAPADRTVAYDDVSQSDYAPAPPVPGIPAPEATADPALVEPAPGAAALRADSAYLLPEIRATLWFMPEQAGVPLRPADGDALPLRGRTARAPDVDALPELRIPGETALALASLYRATSAPSPPDTAMLWLRVGTDGRVPPGGWAVISSTSAQMHYAVAGLVPYLRYAPARDHDRAVPVWVAQRIVVEP